MMVSTSLDEEKEADQGATVWVMGEKREVPGKTKRMMAVVSALAVLLELPVSEEQTPPTHPKSFQHMDACTQLFELESQDNIYRYVAVVLHIHLAQLGYNFSSLEMNGSYEDIYGELLYRRATLNRHT